jgi:hypothetical protein
VWGYYDLTVGYQVFHSTQEFTVFLLTRECIVYAHNGGKFDFMYLLAFLPPHEIVKVQIINGRIVSMKFGKATLVDSLAAVPVGLGSIKKDEIEYWKMGAGVRAEHMPEIIEYMRGDCIYLHELMTAYRRDAGKKKTIASNALAHANKLGIDPGKTNARFDRNYREFYFGGRTQCFQPGHFKNVSVFDIKSSYPRAMMEYHSTGNADVFKVTDTLDGLTRNEIERSFITLRCYADGCFPKRPDNSEGLHFPHAHGEYNVTGWEYIAALDLGLMDDIEILEVKYSSEKITFRDYVMHWFDYKESHPKKTDPIGNTIGKIMMNSLYGKLAQDPEKYYDYKIVPTGFALPCNDPRINEKTKICRVCEFAENDHGWTFYTTFEGKTFHRRESLWKHKHRWGDDWESKNLYKNVATGASITGYARAALLRAMHAVGIEHVIYTDTDSLIVTEHANTNVLPQGKQLGDWECEVACAREAHFAGKKQYAIEMDAKAKCSCNERNGKCSKHKVVNKGARLTWNEMVKIVDGEAILYKAQAPTFSLARGVKPMVRMIRRTAN